MTTTTPPAGPPIGLLANGAAFVPPEYYNAAKAGFAYGSLNDQMKDASGYYDKDGKWVASGWASGAGAFAGNNVPKYNGVAGSDPNGTFAGGFALQPANVGGSTAGYNAYGPNTFDPYKGRGNGLLNPPGGGGGPPGGGGGPPGTTPPGGIITTPPLPPGGVGAPPAGTIVPPRTRGNEPGNYNTPPGITTTPGITNAGAPKTTSPAPGNPASYWATDKLPTPGSNTDLMARTMAASNSWDVGGTQLQGLLGSNEAMHQAGNAYNSGGSRSGGTWNTNYAAVAQNPAPYLAAGIAKANPDGTYEMLKLQDPESQQWIPIAEWQSKYGQG